MWQEEVTFKFHLLKIKVKRINATIVLNLETFSFRLRDFVVILNIFLYSESLKVFKVFSKNNRLGLRKPKLQNVWYVASFIVLWMVCQNWIELNTLVNNALVWCKRIFLDKSSIFLPYGKFNNCTRLWNNTSRKTLSQVAPSGTFI